MLIIPLTADPDSRRQVRLGDNLLTLRTYFNPTVPGWHLDIEDVDGVTLVDGAALVPSINILEASPELTRTLGQFRVLPFEAGDENAADSKIAPLWWFAPGEWEAGEIPQQVDVSLPFDVRKMYFPLPGIPIDSLLAFVEDLETLTERLYDLVNTDFFIRLNPALFPDELEETTIALYELVNEEFNPRLG